MAHNGAPPVFVGALREGLRELGYTEGQNIESSVVLLTATKPAVIVAGAVNTAVAAKNVTSTIPIIAGALADAVHLGLIASYAHPGGNVTGIAPYVDGLPAKQMEFAREIAPGATKVGVLGNLNDPKEEQLPALAEELVALPRPSGANSRTQLGRSK